MLFSIELMTKANIFCMPFHIQLKHVKHVGHIVYLFHFILLLAPVLVASVAWTRVNKKENKWIRVFRKERPWTSLCWEKPLYCRGMSAYFFFFFFFISLFMPLEIRATWNHIFIVAERMSARAPANKRTNEKGSQLYDKSRQRITASFVYQPVSCPRFQVNPRVTWF